MEKKPTPSQIKKLALEIREFLIDREMWIDTTIYFNGIAFSTDDGQGHYFYNDPAPLIVLEDEDPHTYTEYAGDILTMTFEGPLYEVLNYGGYGDNPWQVEEELTAIFRKYGLYYELGNAWDLTAYPL